MKKLNYIKTAFIALGATMMLSSCLKDDSRYTDFAGVAPVVDFPLVSNPYGGGGVFVQAVLSAAATTNQVNFLVDVTGTKDMSTPVTVTTIVDAAALTAYNAANHTTYQLLPATAYKSTSLTLNLSPGIEQVASANEPIVGPPVSLPQGQGAVTFTITTSAALPSGTYVLPLTITSAVGAGTIVDQFHTLMYQIIVQ